MKCCFVEIRRAAFLSCCLAICGMLGCGSREPQPDLAKVTGIVTLDGAPLSGASVSFIPKVPDARGNGRASTAGTDEKGAFSLLYGPGQPGAIVGEHSVQISKLSGTSEEPGSEMLPAKFNSNSELTETVTATGPNHFEISLVTHGKK